jgi:hypothetical protein
VKVRPLDEDVNCTALFDTGSGVVKVQREECKVAEGVEVERYLDEGRKYVEQGDPVQASEKLYKAAEEAVKVLARRFALPEHEEAEGKGRWTAILLSSAVRSLS